MKKLKILIIASVGIIGVLWLRGVIDSSIVSAANTADTKFSQTITPGVLSVFFCSGSNYTPVSDPIFKMDTKSVQLSSQNSEGEFGNNNALLCIVNPGAADNGWTLTLNATNPGVSEWTTGDGKKYKYNDRYISRGTLTIDPSVGTLAVFSPYTRTGITMGSSARFSGSDSVTLMSASASADDFWRGQIKGIKLKQYIPPHQSPGVYMLPMTQTITAL